MWGWPGLFGLLAFPPGILVGLSLAHGLDAWSGRCPLRPGFLAVGLALGTSAVHAPREVILERQAILRIPVEQVWAAVEEPAFWMRWDGLIGELSPLSSGTDPQTEPSSTTRTGDTFSALLKVAGRNVPVRLTVRRVAAKREMDWNVTWPQGTSVERFVFGLHLQPRGDETEVAYKVRYHLPSFGARLANTLALESGVKESMEESLSGLDRWAQEHLGR
jgi:hypothetical protein